MEETKMSKKQKDESFTLEDKEYFLKDVNVNAKALLVNLNFVEDRLQELNNELAVSDTARIGYERALGAEVQRCNTKKDKADG